MERYYQPEIETASREQIKAWQKSLEAMVPAKFLELNKKAFQLGKNA